MVGAAVLRQSRFAALVANYPMHTVHPTDPKKPNSIWALIGGHVQMNEWSSTFGADGNPEFSNSCAIRMSYALNHSGWRIPRGKGTVSGKDHLWYFVRVADLQKYLTAVMGAPQIFKGGSFNGPKGVTGIISYNIPFTNATGHFTLWLGESVVDSDEDYARWPVPTSILFWRID